MPTETITPALPRPVAVLVEAGLARTRRVPIRVGPDCRLPHFELGIADDGRVSAVAYRSTSCVSTLAACEAVALLAWRRPLTEADALTTTEVAAAMTGLAPGRIERVAVAVAAFRRAVADTRCGGPESQRGATP